MMINSVINCEKRAKIMGETKLSRERKRVKFPKSGELVTTSDALCSYCRYGLSMRGGGLRVCDYYLMTKKLRGCKCGECDKFERKTGVRKPKMAM